MGAFVSIRGIVSVGVQRLSGHLELPQTAGSVRVSLTATTRRWRQNKKLVFRGTYRAPVKFDTPRLHQFFTRVTERSVTPRVRSAPSFDIGPLALSRYAGSVALRGRMARKRLTARQRAHRVRHGSARAPRGVSRCERRSGAGQAFTERESREFLYLIARPLSTLSPTASSLSLNN